MSLDNCSPPVEAPSPLCFAKLFKMAFDGEDLKPLRDRLLAQSHANTADRAAALMSLSVIEQILGDKASGLARQAEALTLHRLYQSSWPVSRNALRVLAFKAAGDVSTNTPLEFLLEGSDVVLYSLYVAPGQPLPRAPDHDIAIFTVGESDGDRAVMLEVETLTPGWPCPVLNRPASVFRLSREGLYGLLRGISGLAMAPTVRIGRSDFEDLGRGLLPLGRFLEGSDFPTDFPTDFPLIARPIGSHAGLGLVKLDSRADIASYLASQPDAAAFFLSPYIDYRSADGQFRKYRLVWVDGQPFPHHMAIADQWKVWYYNAGMADSPAKRAEEALFMSCCEGGMRCSEGSLLRRHRVALAEIAKRLGLEYAGIDCAETPDGRLLVFEADISLVVHDMDPKDLYPYKSAPTQKLFAAFYEMLKRKSLAIDGSLSTDAG
jgi:hypothetical protein